jgi:hypothetical protein
MIDPDHELSITRQAALLKISRGTVYYLPRPVSSADLDLMANHGTPTIPPPVIKVTGIG